MHARRSARLLDARDDVTDGDRLTFLLQHAQGARRVGGDLHARLVGLELEQDVVFRDRVAVALHPADDHAFRHRLAQRGYPYVDCHATSSLRVAAPVRIGAASAHRAAAIAGAPSLARSRANARFTSSASSV